MGAQQADRDSEAKQDRDRPREGVQWKDSCVVPGYSLEQILHQQCTES
jgi:hypothetical protein